MTTRLWIIACGTVGILAAQCMGQAPVITSFQDNGRITWTNAANGNAIYRVEWASQAGGPWHSFTYQPIDTIDAFSNTSFAVSVPMFYRIIMQTNQPPPGMVWIDGGDVELGQVAVPDAEPVHSVFVSGFWMDTAEVSKAKWDEVYGWAVAHGYSFDHTGAGKANGHPVVLVNWYDCVKWCNARSEMEGLTPCYYTASNFASAYLYTNGNVDLSNSWANWTATGYRLPTEAEWQKAARGGRQGRLFPWGGDTITHSQANYFSTNDYGEYDISPTRGYHPEYNDGITPYTSPARSFPANGYGLYDMAGNVIEWCWDRFAPYSGAYEIDPRGPVTGNTRVRHGSGWSYHADNCRAAARTGRTPDTIREALGFRVVRTRL